MNKLLLSHKPKDISNEEFIKIWNNSEYTLSALRSLLENMKAQVSTVKRDDFDCHNHYAKLAYMTGEMKAYDFVLSLLPEAYKR